MSTRLARAVLTGVLVIAVSGTVAGTTAAAAGAAERARWLLDEDSGRTARDSSGRGNHGRSYDVRVNGTSYTFNGTSSRVIAPDRRSLDPRKKRFSFGVVVSFSVPPTVGETYDLLRKGTVRRTNGYYKLEVKRVNDVAVARCVVKDARRRIVAIQSRSAPRYDLADGRQHTVSCLKTRRGVTVTVDAQPPRTKEVGRLRRVFNGGDLALGAKAEQQSHSGFDWFRGTMHEAWLTVG